MGERKKTLKYGGAERIQPVGEGDLPDGGEVRVSIPDCVVRGIFEWDGYGYW